MGSPGGTGGLPAGWADAHSAASQVAATAAAPNRYRPQWDELRFGHTGVTTFNSLQAGDAVYFGFEESLARNLVRFEFTAPPRGIGVNPGDPPWRWEAWSATVWRRSSSPGR